MSKEQEQSLPYLAELASILASSPDWAKETLSKWENNQIDEMDLFLSKPEQIMTAAGMEVDPWQMELLLSSEDRLLLNCSRQIGKTQIVAALVLHTAMYIPGSLILIVAPSERQSGEFIRDKVRPLYNACGRPIPPLRSQDAVFSLELANGSRIIALPGKEGTIRGFSGVRLLVLDEASRIPDSLYMSVRPMLAVSKGRMVALSTPYGKRGWFYREWHNIDEMGVTRNKDSWKRFTINARQCPRLTTEFLEEERQTMGDRYFNQEYMCEFVETEGSVFTHDEIHRALVYDVASPFADVHQEADEPFTVFS